MALDAVYGEPLDGVDVVHVPADLAPLFAEAHRRIRHRPAGVHAGDGRVVDHDAHLVSDAPGPERWIPLPEGVVDTLAAAERPIVLAGPGVVIGGAVPGMHALAAAGSLGVLNTWGAKGLFDWRSRHHLATAGLQALDFERGGLADADLILATGTDDLEMLADWRLAPVIELHPWALGPLAEVWGRPRAEIAVPPLRADLARVTQQGWSTTTAPLPPTKVTQHYSRVLGGGGLVAADPGIAGYWVARTFATTTLGGAQVPADGSRRGFAIAASIVARLLEPRRRVLAVVEELGEVEQRLLDVAGSLGVAVGVEEWRDDGDPLDADAHDARLLELATNGGTAALATDPDQLGQMLEVAGPIVAWTA